MIDKIEKIVEQKLALSFLLIISLFIFFGIITVRGMVTLGNLTRTLYDHPLVVSNASLIAALNITKMHRGMKDVVLADTSIEFESALNAVADAEHIAFQQLDIIRKDILGKEGQLLEEQTRQLLVNWKPIRKEVVEHLNSDNPPAAIHITKAKGADHVATLEKKMLELSAYARNKATTFLELAETSQSSLENVTLFLTITGVVISLIIAYLATSRILKTETILIGETRKLQQALDEIKTLRGIIPICSHCKQIRDDEGLWKQIEDYIHAHSEARLSHGICPNCVKKYYPNEYKAILTKQKQKN